MNKSNDRNNHWLNCEYFLSNRSLCVLLWKIVFLRRCIDVYCVFSAIVFFSFITYTFCWIWFFFVFRHSAAIEKSMPTEYEKKIGKRNRKKNLLWRLLFMHCRFFAVKQVNRWLVCSSICVQEYTKYGLITTNQC